MKSNRCISFNNNEHKIVCLLNPFVYDMRIIEG